MAHADGGEAQLSDAAKPDAASPTAGATFAARLEQRFAQRPHVGVVTHFEGWDVPRAAAFVRNGLAAAGLDPEFALEEVNSGVVFSAAAAVPAGEGGAMELWLMGREQPAVGCALEIRLFHTIDDAALADEYLAQLAQRLAQPRFA